MIDFAKNPWRACRSDMLPLLKQELADNEANLQSALERQAIGSTALMRAVIVHRQAIKAYEAGISAERIAKMLTFIKPEHKAQPAFSLEDHTPAKIFWEWQGVQCAMEAAIATYDQLLDGGTLVPQEEADVRALLARAIAICDGLEANWSSLRLLKFMVDQGILVTETFPELLTVQLDPNDPAGGEVIAPLDENSPVYTGDEKEFYLQRSKDSLAFSQQTLARLQAEGADTSGAETMVKYHQAVLKALEEDQPMSAFMQAVAILYAATVPAPEDESA